MRTTFRATVGKEGRGVSDGGGRKEGKEGGAEERRVSMGKGGRKEVQYVSKRM